ncbi:S1 family peptidase [Streptomyces sp. NBC_00316]|uniref:S1 family peptidase n=1 Tax=Streptomyces sp. NBC_00316 TaxID=2975710 RepID=UPI002E29CD39|nr:S1 family peptidase [Streptomyces sp. NBC_00316]
MSHIRPRVALTSTLLAAGVVSGVLTGTSAQAVTGGTAATDTTYGYTARLVIGDTDRGCSGTLVDTEWLLTAASCFADSAGAAVSAGVPKLKTTATIGRSTDLAGSGGAVRQVVAIVPRTDRDVVLARLNRPVTNVTPIALATTAPAAGEELKFAGFGRTKTEWAPMNLHTGAYTVDSADATTAAVTGKADQAACAGDAGGPVIRGTGTSATLVGLSAQSYQAGCFGIDATETRTGGVAARVDDLASWVDSKVAAPRITDFNCDGVEDIAVSDPKGVVGGNAGAGLVRVVYGGGKGTAEINQDLDWVSGGSEAGDSFGESLATVDYDEDGCTDLVVATPADDIGTVADAGMVDILHGAPGGIGTGTKKDTHFEQGAGTGVIAASASESGDRMGQALAAGTTAAGEPFLAIGVPGESVGTIAKAGAFFYLRGTTSVGVQQDSTGVPGGAEANDGFGAVIAADANHIAVGAPNEAIGADAGAGNLAVFDHKLNADGKPTPLFGLDQDLDTVSGGAEAGDLFGKSLAMVPYRPSGAAAATESILAVGSPGEDLAIDGVDKADTGSVYTFRVTAAGTYTQLDTYTTGTADDDVSGTAEAGDGFGAALTAVNTAPRAVSTTATLKMAVGAPNEVVGTAAKAGAISVFSLLGAPGVNDKWLEAGDGDGIPGTPGANQQVGASIHFTGTKLYVGMPYGPSTYGALHALPMSNVTIGGTTAVVTTYQPGQGGLPAAGVDFGYLAR